MLSLDLVSPWEIEAVVMDIKQLSSNANINFHFVPQSCNLAVQQVAKEKHKGKIPLDWVSIPPRSLVKDLEYMFL